MGFTIQHPIDLKVKVLAEYKEGVVGYKTLAVKYGLQRDTVRYWVLQQKAGRGLPMDTINKNTIDDEQKDIESIKTRLKSPESLLNKMIEKQLPLTVESIENNINDVAGVRVICSYVSDIYMLADVLLKQDDIVLVKRKDYIANPKENGYRSLHLIVQIPIFLHDKKRMMKVEVQFRTISMDCWASLEHKIRYKKDVHISPEIAEDLRSCAEICEVLDQKMEAIQNKVRPASL